MVGVIHDAEAVCRICSGGLRPTRVAEPMERRAGRSVLPADMYTLGVCSRCGLAQVNFSVDQSYLDESYAAESEALIREITGCAPSELSAARTPEFARVLDLVARFVPADTSKGMSLLDVGCQDGRLLELAEARGFQAVGLEPSIEYAEEARRRLPTADIVTGPLGTPTPRQADVVVFLETLEHIADPRAALTQIKALGRPNGLVVISVPSWAYFKVKSLVFRLLRRPMSQIHLHITCFSRRSMYEVGNLVGGKVEYLEPTGWHGPLRFANKIVRRASQLRIPFLRDFAPSLTVVIRTAASG